MTAQWDHCSGPDAIYFILPARAVDDVLYRRRSLAESVFVSDSNNNEREKKNNKNNNTRKQYYNIIMIIARRVVKLLRYVLYFNLHCLQQTSLACETSSPPWSSTVRGIYVFIKKKKNICRYERGLNFKIIVKKISTFPRMKIRV